jgi:hypothetical protein
MEPHNGSLASRNTLVIFLAHMPTYYALTRGAAEATPEIVRSL